MMLKQTKVVNCRFEKYDTYIGRPSIWGNPYSHRKEGTLAKFIVPSRYEAIEKYREYILKRLKEDESLMRKFNQEIHHKTLGCWCSPKSCHGDVLTEISEQIDAGVDIFSSISFTSEKKIEDNGAKRDIGSSPID
jgi:hypothetical protein